MTGSGKTEVYFDVVSRTIEAGKQVLILLPEIAPSAAWKQFSRPVRRMPTERHSDVAAGRKRRPGGMRRAAHRSGRGAFGAVSSVVDLGLIIVDEEHEQAYKQEDQVVYHARDMAAAPG